MKSENIRKLILGIAGIVIVFQIALNSVKLVQEINKRQEDSKKVKEVIRYNSEMITNEVLQANSAEKSEEDIEYFRAIVGE